MLEQYWRRQGRKIPMNSVLDLFLFIGKDLGVDYEKKRDRVTGTYEYRLSSGTLDVGLEVTIDHDNIVERLDLRKSWDAGASERLSYSMDYSEPHIYEAHRREKMKSDPSEEWFYRTHLQWSGRNRYLSNEMFIDNMTIVPNYDCGLDYETTRLSRGLTSLAHLKLPRPENSGAADKEVFSVLYARLISAGGRALVEQLGPDPHKWRPALRRGKAHIAVRFKISLPDVNPVWIVGRGLVDLCRIYARQMVN